MLMLEVESDSDQELGEETSQVNQTGDTSDSDNTPLINVVKKRKLPRKKTGNINLNVHSKRSRISKDVHGTGRGELLSCLTCCKSFKSVAKLTVHQEKHIKYKCEECDKTFSSQRSFERHKERFPGKHMFQCKSCTLWFHRGTALRKHEITKHPDMVPTALDNTCEFCAETFPDKILLLEHCNAVHSNDENNGAKYNCTICDKPFISEEGLRYHEERHRSEVKKPKKEETDNRSIQSFTCKICSSIFESKSVLQMHLKSHNVTKNIKPRPGSHQCCVCPRSFTSSDGLKYHLATHTGERRFGCDKCGRRFIKKTHLSEHIATHSVFKLFKCSRCPRTFTTYSAYRKHMKMFPGPHSFNCDKCGKLYTKESMLEKHMCVNLTAITLDPEVTAQLSEDMIEQYLCLAEEADREAGENGLKSCYKCFKMFPSLAALQQHQNEHVGKQVYQCRFCPTTLLRADAFSAHIRNHLGSTPYMCLQCNRKFISPFTLANHAKHFPGPHSFSCQRCKRWFPSPERLDKHECILQNCDYFACACGSQFTDWNQLLEHAGNKPYKCCICDQKYLTLMPLARHIKSHTGARPYACNLCTKSFRSKNMYNTHMKYHNGSEVLPCKLCNYVTRSQKRLDIHLYKKHNDGTSTTSSTLCPVCGVLLPSLTQMKRHLEQQHGNAVTLDAPPNSNKKNLQQELCTHCGKLLNNRYSLASHIKKVHDPSSRKNTISFKCPTCEAAFKTERQLDRHCESHEPQGPIQCSTCLIEVKTLKELRKHMRRHDTSKPYSCEQCGKMFKVAVSLRYHRTICGNSAKNVKMRNGDTIVYKDLLPLQQISAPLYF